MGTDRQNGRQPEDLTYDKESLLYAFTELIQKQSTDTG